MPRVPQAMLEQEPDESFVQRTVPARGAARPLTTAPNSVFDAGRQAHTAAEIPPLATHQIVIRKGIPKPAVRTGRTAAYAAVLAQMQPGDSVELPLKQANGFYARAKEFARAATPPPAVQPPQDRRGHSRHLA